MQEIREIREEQEDEIWETRREIERLEVKTTCLREEIEGLEKTYREIAVKEKVGAGQRVRVFAPAFRFKLTRSMTGYEFIVHVSNTTNVEVAKYEEMGHFVANDRKKDKCKKDECKKDDRKKGGLRKMKMTVYYYQA